jgi:dTDP-4-dehydrorhamnose 3,5-epimerase-like enzyme
VSALHKIHTQKYVDDNGCLCVFENGRDVPFNISRVFTVSAQKGDLRGQHAHKACVQLLVCVYGEIRVTCDDGVDVTAHTLSSMSEGLVVPSGVWAEQEYLMDNSVLMVLCDRGYEPEDYIREYNEFRAFIESRKEN